MHLSNLVELSIPESQDTWVFTLGKFDGFHAGHKALIKEMKTYGNKLAVLSFSNHPYAVLNPSQKIPYLQTLEHRIFCAKEEGIDVLIVEPFTLDLAKLSYGDFLQGILNKIPFKHLVLGEGSFFGRNKEGDEAHVKEWCSQKGIEAHYIKKTNLEGQEVSSKTLRNAIASATTPVKLQKASSLLQRPYSVLARFQRYGNRYALSRHHLEDLLLPSIQECPASVLFEGKTYSATLHFSPPGDFHLEGLELNIPAGILEVRWSI